ncbi:MAG: hypothetical protein AB7S75_22370 [Desulfococcaceae bacterium]
MKINIPVQFTGTGQKLEAFDTLMVYSFLEITLRQTFRIRQTAVFPVIPEKAGIRYFQTVPDTGFHRYDESA